MLLLKSNETNKQQIYGLQAKYFIEMLLSGILSLAHLKTFCSLVFWKWDTNEKLASKWTVSLFIWTQINYQLKLDFVSSKQSNRGAVSRTHWALKSLTKGLQAPLPTLTVFV